MDKIAIMDKIAKIDQMDIVDNEISRLMQLDLRVVFNVMGDKTKSTLLPLWSEPVDPHQGMPGAWMARVDESDVSPIICNIWDMGYHHNRMFPSGSVDFTIIVYDCDYRDTEKEFNRSFEEYIEIARDPAVIPKCGTVVIIIYSDHDNKINTKINQIRRDCYRAKFSLDKIIAVPNNSSSICSLSPLIRDLSKRAISERKDAADAALNKLLEKY